MAISNLKNEPRREIIEQAVGIAAIVAFLFLDYAFVRWLGAVDKADVIFGMIFVAGLAPPAVLTLVFGVHVWVSLFAGDSPLWAMIHDRHSAPAANALWTQYRERTHNEH